MTAIKPIESRHVRGVASTRHPLNAICGHPDCSEPTESAHHIFPRSFIGNDSWFVEIRDEDAGVKLDLVSSKGVPHVIGLCGSGTTGHHGDVEEHRAWIKLEDGEYVWYDRASDHIKEGEVKALSDGELLWAKVGPLNPQPGAREGKPKRKRTQKGTAERAARKTISVRLPEGVDGDYWDSLVADAGEIELMQEDTQFDTSRGAITVGKLLVTVLERFTGRVD